MYKPEIDEAEKAGVCKCGRVIANYGEFMEHGLGLRCKYKPVAVANALERLKRNAKRERSK